MLQVDICTKVRRAVMVEGLSQRGAARRYGIDRKTAAKMVGFSVPPGCRRTEKPVARKLGAPIGIINRILEADKAVLKKQRHTAHRIFERLCDEHGYAGGCTTVREFVARERLRQKEVFVPLSHRPGHAQADLGEADIYLNEAKTRCRCRACTRSTNSMPRCWTPAPSAARRCCAGILRRSVSGKYAISRDPGENLRSGGKMWGGG